MKVGVLSDIHLKKDDGRVQKIIDRYLSDVDMIFLCGDLISMAIYEMFSHKKVAAVAGNMDDYTVKSSLPFKRVVEINGFKFGLIHGWGSPVQIEDKIKKEFDNVDCIVYGHTHSAENKKKGGTMFFNPGSPTDKRFAPFNSIGMLNVTEDKIDGEIIEL
jgi:putative phosphoesterase